MVLKIYNHWKFSTKKDTNNNHQLPVFPVNAPVSCKITMPQKIVSEASAVTPERFELSTR